MNDRQTHIKKNPLGYLSSFIGAERKTGPHVFLFFQPFWNFCSMFLKFLMCVWSPRTTDIQWEVKTCLTRSQTWWSFTNATASRRFLATGCISDRWTSVPPWWRSTVYFNDHNLFWSSWFVSSAILLHQSECRRHWQQSETAGRDHTEAAGGRKREEQGRILGGVWCKTLPDFL